MFPTFISILDIQSWWEVPSIAHFCSLFRTSFNLLDFDIEDLEEALLTDGTEESSWLQELIVRLLSGCLPNNEISTFNYQMFLRRLFRQKCQEHDRYNPFNTDIDFQLLPLRTKVDILHALCDFRLDAEDVLELLKNLEAESLRVEPLGYDGNESAYWYFYGTRLYREDYTTKNNKKKSVWQVICFTEDDWFQLTKKFKKSDSKLERQLHHTLSENFLPELPRLFKEKENLARKRVLENQPRRTSDRLRELKCDTENDLEKDRVEARQRRSKSNRGSEEESAAEETDDCEMAGPKNKKSKSRQRKMSSSSAASKDEKSSKSSKRSKKHGAAQEKTSSFKPATVGRQTNNSLSAATGQILIQPMANANTNKKKVKTSQIFRQTEEDLQVGMHKILDYVQNHEDAWPFADPVEEEYAPNYYSVIRKPMDLQRMEERLDSGYYKNFSKFRADFQLIVDNCRLYNGAENEYTEMVDNLLKVFEKATEKYLDQISSSDDEIAVEFSSQNSDKTKPTKSEVTTTTSRRKPMLAAQTDKKRTRSISERSLGSSRSSSFESIHSEFEEEERKSAPKHKHERSGKVKKGKLEMVDVKKEKLEGKLGKIDAKKEKLGGKKEPAKGKPEIKKEKLEARKEKAESKPEKLSGSSSKKENVESAESKKARAELKKGKKGGKHDGKKTNTEDKPRKVVKAVKKPKKKVISRSPSRSMSGSPPPSDSPPPSWPPSSPESSGRVEDVTKNYKKRKAQELSDSEEVSKKGPQTKYSYFDDFFEDFEESLPQTKKSKPEEPLLSPKPKDKHNKLRETIEKLKAKSEMKLNDFQFELDHPKENRDKNKKYDRNDKIPVKSEEKAAEIEADSNSNTDSFLSESKKGRKIGPNSTPPAHKTSNMEALSIATEQTLKDINKWLDDTPKFAEFSSASNSPSYAGLDEFDTKPEQMAGRKPPPKRDPKKKPARDPAKFFKRREIQRTIDRLQPGKGKGNLISNVPNPAEELFPLGPLSKHHKDPKNALIVKTDSNAPKLSLGSVLNSFGKHEFVQESVVEAPPAAEPPRPEAAPAAKEAKAEAVEDHAGGATPNLSAWFKAFGAPKPPPPPKKPEEKPEEPAGQRQRRVSTGSSVSERSSFSQDLDSPRVGMDERGAYPAPYPSPMHRSPAASPRPDISPKAAAYPAINGQMRVGFYQDTVSEKSSPEKSESSPSPYPHYSEHVYTPNSPSEKDAYYGYPNSAYYAHAPNYSTTNPTPPYNQDGSTTPNYTANSPLSNQSSPSVGMDMPPNSPGVYSQHSPTIHNAPAAGLGPQNSPAVPQQHSPSVQSYQSQEEQGSPGAAKKRAYDDEVPPMGNHKYRIDAKLSEKKDKPYIQNVPDPKAMGLQASGGYPAGYDADAFKQPKMDLSEYMNMGYTGPEVGYTRSLQFGSSEMSFTTAATQQMGYKGVDMGGNPQQGHSNVEVSRGERLSQIQDVSAVNAARYNVSHMVDRFTANDDRMMASYYSDKGLGTSHLFNKQMGSNGAMFGQANMAAVQGYNQNVQSNTAGMFGRQMSELQSSVGVPNEMKVGQQQMQVVEKKSKKRKGKSVAALSSDAPQQPNVPAAVQGFQSYAGLKANPPIEPGAISLKTSSVVPGSAFNFGPSAASLGLYGDKDGYPNFLDEFRSAPNYYMAAAAAAHHRATPDGGDKQSRPAHQNSNPQTNPAYPFLGAPQARTSYPLGSPFMPNAQAQLMDTNPSIYQHYLQAGLLGAHGAYPPGYHPLGMRQPYDPMTRPSWL